MALTLARLAPIALLLLHSLAIGAAELTDGPYVLRGKQNEWIALSLRDGEVVHHETDIDGDISVAAVGDLPSFTVPLREPGPAAPSVVTPSAKTPLFVIADTHGELEIAVALLRAHEIVDDALRWSFGSGHLVILGDVFDRGAHHTELLWLIYKLEGEALRAGGAVHLILGNHETMVLLGDDRYLHAKYKESTKAFGAPHYAALWSEHTLLGRWLRTKPAVMKIGEHLCLHGGLSAEVAARQLTLDRMNTTVRDALQSRHVLPEPQHALASFVMGPNGPLWYRGYFEPKNDHYARRAPPEEVANVLEFYGARKILVGHTAVPTITPLYDGKVIAVQVYPHRTADGAPVMEGLAIENGRYFKALVDGSRIEIAESE